ncbi:smd-1 [Pristionchus pacificus]|uniref:S-adenosylmethionine decarboxylase proenzyme n=1 Tax=Pristionchus pacificus TaxID=54126 RepID=A0A8R1ULY7_PRIPA|nr:smd-1 [Pristionchus pacificus]
MPAQTAVAVLPTAGPDKDALATSPDYFFEGAEKLLEVWFGSSSEVDGVAHPSMNGASLSMRSIPREEWDDLCSIAACRILHAMSNSHMDSFVLSESSLFVSDRRVIMKTCGGTRLLAALPRLLELAEKYAGLDQVVNVYYSRKNFARPDLQPKLHRSFDGEIDYLDKYFDESNAYCLGSMKSDRWYLYTSSLPQAVSTYPDHTLEILMTEMPQHVLDLFTRETCVDGPDCTVKTGIDRIMPAGTEIHEELFDPCGYSMNALVSNSDKYATIHVTPEAAFSYASFETNQDHVCLFAQTKRVLECFQPHKFLLTIFSNEHSESAKATQQQLWEREMLGYRRTSVQFVRLETEEQLVYAHYVRKHNWGSSSSEDEGERSE